MLDMQCEIIKANINDAQSLRLISSQTFIETFSEQNSEENMQKYISESLSIEQLGKELNSPYSEFYFLKNQSEIIGYLKLNSGESQTELKNNISLEIERIYVKKAFHGKYLGKQLLNKAIEIAKEKGYQYIWLAVWEHNLQAINFYLKQGFIEFDKHTFLLGDDAQVDIMMKLELK
jgi:diamine N-acetyltransferase